mgnify:FL=1
MARAGVQGRKAVLYGAITVVVTLMIAFAVGEFVLHQQRLGIEGSDNLDKGLFAYDPDLGWRLQPGWSGRHRHHDFDVAYKIGANGFRGNFRAARTRVAIVGDSFTFGFGAGVGQTFPELLDQMDPDRAVMNFGVPGYSTNQEVLLIEEVLPAYKPDLVLLVVYLGNDIADNMRLFPLQLDNAKPYFELADGQLIRRNNPVPKQRKPAHERGVHLGQIILAGSGLRPGFLQATLGRSETLRRLGLDFTPDVDLRDHFQRRQQRPLALFQALVLRARAAVVARGSQFGIILLAGRSFVQKPQGLSAQYQEFLRQSVSAWAAKKKIPLADTAGLLQSRFLDGQRGDYYANEGHLTVRGHKVVARFIARWIKNRSEFRN